MHQECCSRLGVWLSVLLLRALHLPTNNVLPDIVFLGQVEELPDLRCSLGTETLGQDVVGQSRDVAVALLDDDERQDGDIGTNNAAADGFALALTGAADAVARVTIGEEQSDTVGNEDTLLHWETLLVVSAGNTEDVALPFVSERVTRNLLRDLLLVEDTAMGQKKYASEMRYLYRTTWSRATHNFFSSSKSMVFCSPVAGSVIASVLDLYPHDQPHFKTYWQC